MLQAAALRQRSTSPIGFRPFGEDIAATAIDGSHFAVDREPIPSLIATPASCALRPATSIDKLGAADDAGLSHLPALPAPHGRFGRRSGGHDAGSDGAKPPMSAVVDPGRTRMTESPLATSRAALSGSKTARPTAMPADAPVPANDWLAGYRPAVQLARVL